MLGLLYYRASRDRLRDISRGEDRVWRGVLALLNSTCAALQVEGIGQVSIEGSTAKTDRMEAIRRFQEDYGVKVFAGSSVLE